MKKSVIAAVTVAMSVAVLSANPFQHNRADGASVVKNRFQAFRSACSPFHGIVLDEAQRNAMRSLKDEVKRELAALKDELTMPLLAAVQNGAFDKQAYTEAVMANKALTVPVRADAVETMYTILTPEQQQQLQENLHAIENNGTCPGVDLIAE